jgi:thiosulfate/3-mercaptopyruvate sulfurtransferase
MIPLILLASLLAPPAADTVLVPASWLRRHLQDPGLIVLQVGMDDESFSRGHIRGARFAPMDRFHSHADPNRLPDPGSIAAALGALGVTNRSRVVIAGDPLTASIMFVALDYVGLGSRTAILDGGVAAWTAAGGELTQESSPVVPATFTPEVNNDLVVDAAWVLRHRNDRGVVLIDARSRAEYDGTAAESLPRRGHLPGARHLNWTETLDPNDLGENTGEHRPPDAARLRPEAELERMLAQAGADRSGLVVTYCTVGMRASHLYFVARHLGYPARIYVGSMADWTRDPARPVEGAGR